MGPKALGLTYAAAVAAILSVARPASAQLYSESFVNIVDQNLATVGWDSTSATEARTFDHSGSNFPNEAVTGDGLDTGTAYFFRNRNGVEAMTTTEFAAINPTAGSGVDIVWWQTEQGITAGSTVDVHPAVMVGGQWYASGRAFSTTDAQFPWNRQLLAYSPAKANWLALTLNAGSATLGATPGVDLSGNITGLGFVTVMNNVIASYDAAGVLLAAQPGRETVWYDYIEIAAHVTPGDVNGVGGVTIEDFNIIKANYRTNVTMRSQGDLNQDRVVDVLDFREWKANFPGAFDASGFSIPEPSGGAIALAALAFGWAARRRDRRRLG